MNCNKIRCALYDRVSTERQVEFGLSLDAQKDALTAYAMKHDYEIAGIYTDEGITARKKMQNRKELNRLLQDVRANQIDLILVTKLDRWFRNIKDYHNTQAILTAHNCNWKTIYEEYDTTTSNGRFAINIMLSVAENECDRTSERIRSTFEYKKKNKQLLSGAPAYGYKTVNKKLVKDPDAAPIVEDIIAHYFTFFSKRATTYFIQEKYLSNAPSSYKISRILGSCKTYIGEMYGIPNYCEPYLTPEQYHFIKRISDTKYHAVSSEPYLFSQLIKCPICGGNFTGFIKKRQKKDKSFVCYKRYRCHKKFEQSHQGACISESVIVRFLIENIQKEIGSNRFEIFSITPTAATPKSLSPKKICLEQARLNYIYQKGRISQTFYDAQYHKLNDQLDIALTAQSSPPNHTSSSLKKHKITGSWQELYQRLDPLHQQAFWRGLLASIHIDVDSHRLSCFEFNEV